MVLKDFTIEYRKNPIGLDVNPRFSWKLINLKENTMQKAYHLLVMGKEGIIWDSKKVESEESIFIPFGGDQLEPFTAYTVKVTVWDNYDSCASAEGSFETGLLSQKNWKGKWITHNMEEKATACPIFTKSFHAKNVQINKARMYATACGVYEIEINGEKADDTFLAPGWTSYHNRLQYQTYDITQLIKTNENRVCITVGNGWYKGYLNGEGENAFYGDRVAFLGMIYIEYADGEKEIIGTGSDWSYTTGHIQSSELYFGEEQDFTRNKLQEKEQEEKAILFDSSDKVRCIVSQESNPVRIIMRIKANKKIITPKGELVIDFGQNLVGVTEIKLPKLKDKKLTVYHAETLDKEGNFYTENYRTAISTDSYIYGDEDVGRVVLPHFTYHGFRFIKLEGVHDNIDINRFCACVMHTDMEQTGEFHCSNPSVNQLQNNIQWSQRGNYVDIPTDCPQRDERLGWTGDAQIFAGTGSYNFNTALFFKKWMKDVAAESDEQRGVPQIVPNIIKNSIGTSVWSDCSTVIPWTVYQMYGDKQILEEQYENMKLWVEYIRKNTGKNVLWLNGFQRGDWLSLDSDASLNLMSGGTDKNLVANVYYAYSTRILRDTAKILGKEDYIQYSELYVCIVEAIIEEYVTSTGRLVTETQTACALLLYFDLLKEQYKPRVIEILENNLVLHRGHLTTGFVGTAFLCHALTENGRHNLAENILLSEDYPGWLYAVKMGATTIWERWDSILPDGEFNQLGMNSLNHYSFGSVGDWMYRKIAGINPLEAGYKRILIKPHLTLTMPDVEAKLESVYGTIRYSQKCAGKRIMIEVEIPANTSAVAVLPEREDEIEIGSGTYRYEYDIHTVLEAGKYCMNTKMGELFEDDYALKIMNESIPGFKENPMIEFLRNKTLSELIAITPGGGECFERSLSIINEHYLNK